MVIATPARRREAENLQALLDGRRASTPAAAADLADLVTLAGALSPRAHLPEPAFRADLRARLVAQVESREPRATRGRPPARTRFRQAVAVVTLTAVVAGAGAAAASTRALPGDPLYGLKRSIERAELSLAHGDVGQGRELLEQADARLGEAEALAAGSDASSRQTQARLSKALADMDAAVTVGADDLVRAYRDTGDAGPLLMLDRFVAEQQERLDDLLRLLDPAQRAQAQALLHQLAVLGEQTSAVLGPQARALGVQELAAVQRAGASGGGLDGASAAGVVDKAAAAAAGGESSTGGSAVGGVLGAVGSATGATTGGGTTSAGSSSGGGGLVGGVVGRLTGGSTSSSPRVSAAPLPTATSPVSAPLPTSSPLATDPVGTVTSAVPLPTSSALPTVSCVPVPPLTTC